MPQETWYVLEDGSVVHPRDVNNDGKGFVTEDGRRVARREGVDAYSTRSVDPEVEAAKPAAPRRGRPPKAKEDAAPDAGVAIEQAVADDAGEQADAESKAAPARNTRDMSNHYKNRGL